METIVHTENGKYLGQTRFAPTLLRESLALCVKEVRGVAGLGKKNIVDKILSKGIEIKKCKDSNHFLVNVYISVLNGFAVPEVAYRVQEAVINTAAQLTTEKIDQVNIYVKGTKYGASTKQK